MLTAAGPKAIARNMVIGGVLLAIIEGVALYIQNFVAKLQKGARGRLFLFLDFRSELPEMDGLQLLLWAP